MYRINEKNLLSYNCFYSALAFFLGQYDQGYSPLIINNRWQLFFKEGEDYSDDRRFIGEHPLPYDSRHLYELRKLLGIEVEIRKAIRGMADIDACLREDKRAFLFVNRFCYDNKPHARDEKCVTTICLQDRKGDQFFYRNFDLNLEGNRWVSREDLVYSWEQASEFEILNRAHIRMQADRQAISPARVCSAFIRMMKDSLYHYLQGDHSEGYSYGNQAFNLFIRNIGEWNSKDYQRFVDCSMYMNIILRQRQFIQKALRQFSLQTGISGFREQELAHMIDLWDRLKTVLFLMGMRKQTEAVSGLREQIREIRDREYEYAAFLYEKMDALNHGDIKTDGDSG